MKEGINLKIFFIYIITINLLGFTLMYIDKKRAKSGDWRIPEKNLWLIALLGGATGSTIGMFKFHHKNKHIQFKIGFPLLVCIQIFIIVYLIF